MCFKLQCDQSTQVILKSSLLYQANPVERHYLQEVKKIQKQLGRSWAPERGQNGARVIQRDFDFIANGEEG